MAQKQGNFRVDWVRGGATPRVPLLQARFPYRSIVARSAVMAYKAGSVDVRFYIDPETGDPHIYRHSVLETEVEDVLARPLEDGRGAGNARVAIGQTGDGRYLRVIYARDASGDSLFVITAYQLGAKALRALRRRQGRGR